MIVRVPQKILGVDVGHISVLIENYDGKLASVGFYSKSYRQGLARSMVTSDNGILVSPDPLYMKASRDPKLKPLITPLYRGTLTASQAKMLNDWTDDQETKTLELTKFTTSAGEARETATATLEDRYVGAANVLPGAENCATWVQKVFPGAITCSLGLPRLCKAAADKGT